MARRKKHLNAFEAVRLGLASHTGLTSSGFISDKFTNSLYEAQIYDNQRARREKEELRHTTWWNYPENRAKLKDGDVLAFVGCSSTDKTINAFTGSEYAHVAVVCNCLRPEAEALGAPPDSVIMMESFGSHHSRGVPDCLDGTIRSGTQAHIVWKRMDAVKGDTVFAHQLRHALDEAETARFRDFLLKIHQEAAEYDYTQCIGTATGKQKRDYSQFFCSELVAAALIAAGRLKESTNPSDIVPGDFKEKNGKLGAQVLEELFEERWTFKQVGIFALKDRMSHHHSQQKVRKTLEARIGALEGTVQALEAKLRSLESGQ